MEKGEGVAVRLLFTGDCKSDFQVAGRVIGSSGFRPLQGEYILFFFLIGLAVAGAVCSVMLISHVEQYLKSRFPKRLGLIGVATSVLFVISTGLIGVTVLVARWVVIGYALSWLPQ